VAMHGELRDDGRPIWDKNDYVNVARVSVRDGPFAPQSLFTMLPPTRTCEAAGISAGHCTAESSLDAAYACVGYDIDDRSPELSMSEFEARRELGQLFAQHSESAVDALLVLLDQDADGAWQGSELQPVHTALAASTSSEPDFSQEVFWCAMATLRVTTVLTELNVGYSRQSSNNCAALTLHQLDAVVVSRPRDSWLVAVSFTVSQGQPRSRYELILRVPWDVPRWEASMQPITRYAKYRACTPANMDPKYCVCSTAL